jgi:diguanylate cyclase (GGDEF)-like protein
MNLKTLVSKVKELQIIDESVITTLYTLSFRSLLGLLLLTTLTTAALYPILHSSIVLWFLSLVLLTGYRLYDASLFKKSPARYSMEMWYKKFILNALLTAVVFSTIGFIFIRQVDSYYQLFILAVVLGLSSGSKLSLSPDIRLNIVYTSILLFPIIITMLFLYNTPLHLILTGALVLYFIVQVTIIYKIYIQKKEFKSLQSEHMFLHSLFKNAPLGIFTYNKDLEVLECNEHLHTLFDHQEKRITGMDLHTLPDSRILGALKDSLTQGAQSYEGPYRSLNSEDFWIEAKAFSFSDTDDRTLGSVAMIEDKTKEHKALEELKYMVEHDSLTGLLNRRGFTNYIEDLVNNTEHKTHFSILFYLDLNQFKSINDSMGHTVGDNVLLAVSKRLQKFLDKSCVVGRLGGDEFIIVVPYISEDKDMTNKEAHVYSQQIQDAFLEPFKISEMYLHIKSSMGIVIVEPGSTNTTDIIRHADLSMYQAKTTNSRVAYYDSYLDKKQKDLFLLQHELACAVKENQFSLSFQPIASIKENTLCSAEALIRWQHPTKGVLSPERFIPLAIKAGLLSKITWWLIDRVCQYIAQWKKENQWKLEYVSINVNAQQFVENNFAIKFLEKLNQYGLETKDIMIEITERSLIDNFDNTQDVINALRRKGVKCAIDDFGIGYSSLSYLKKLSFHTLKIDKEFIKNIESNPKEMHLVSSILDIGRQFNYNIIIEGIENEQQQELLREMDPKLRYQGYHFSKAIKVEEFCKRFLI